MKRDWARLLTIGGAVVIMQSLFWEYARMQPDNNYLVMPWSARGLDSIHGIVFFVLGATLLATGLIVASKFTKAPRNSLMAVGAMVVAAVVLTLIFAAGESVTVGSGLGGAVIGLGVGFVIYLAAQRFAESRLDPDSGAASALRGGTGSLMLIGSLVVGSLLTGLIFGDGIEMSAAVGMLIVMSLLAAITSLMKQQAMAANRMLMASAVVTGTVIGLSGAAIRSTLIRLQAEGGNIPGQYRDTQVTWGYFLANIGVVLFFMGAVMLWARRRDIVQAEQRAAKQRAAAEASAAELAAAG
ncbi:MAG: hypothetical protein HKN91_17015 [Acidimicrobiia bacterium]|nr:hypothetical protein [Acidimicrobiia bacterium]